MPLFECSKCNHVDNTALGDFWMSLMTDGPPPLCTECKTGKWHERFKKLHISAYPVDTVQYPIGRKDAD